jgi:hypothetical protein
MLAQKIEEMDDRIRSLIESDLRLLQDTIEGLQRTVDEQKVVIEELKNPERSSRMKWWRLRST